LSGRVSAFIFSIVASAEFQEPIESLLFLMDHIFFSIYLALLTPLNWTPCYGTCEINALLLLLLLEEEEEEEEVKCIALYL